MAIAEFDTASPLRPPSRAAETTGCALDTLPVGVVAISLDGAVRVWNRAAERATGQPAGEVIGTSLHEAIGLAETSPALTAALDALRDGARWSGIIDASTRHGSRIGVDVEAFPIWCGGAAPELAVAYCRHAESESAPADDTLRAVASVLETRRDERAASGLDWVGRIRSALVEDRFELHAQPIVSVSSGLTVTHELLLRMHERDGTLIEPSAFLPAAAEFSLIETIDRWVIARAAELTAPGVPIEFNLSAQSLCNPHTVEYFRRQIDRTGAEPSLMVIEVTESGLLEDEAAAERSLNRLTAMGCRVALDDFGTGYGTFRYLKRLPVDYLKIDREFVTDLATDGASWHVVSAIVSLARAFGQWTVAEGVEDERTLEILGSMGVDFAQGFAIARPAPVSELDLSSL